MDAEQKEALKAFEKAMYGEEQEVPEEEADASKHKKKGFKRKK